MFAYDERLTKLILDYCRERLALDPVPLDYGGASLAGMAAALEGLINSTGNDPGHVLDIFTVQLAPGIISCDSPRYLSFIPAAPTKAALLFDMVVACSSLHGTSWLEAAGMVMAENQALATLARYAGLPAAAGGCFVAGGSAGNLSALMVARDTHTHRTMRPLAGRPCVAISQEAHSSIAKALAVLGLDPLIVPTPDHRFTGPALAQALTQDPRAGELVAVVATAGTTNAGIVDDLAGLGNVAHERGLWFHVDGAYGGAALFAPSARARFAGIEQADSFVVDPHKWLFAPYDCAALLYAQPNLAKAVHSQDASYLDALHTGADDEWNPSDYAYHLTRRARGLPLWFSLAVYGTQAYTDAIETVQLTLLREPELSVVLFARNGWDRADYEHWSADLLAAQTGFVVPTTYESATVGRLALLNPETTVEIIAEILATTN
jgi:glutamate/tyrosine decarboxylase-like PLP-dependent enzyme